MKEKLVVIVGPTAVGKSKLGVELAKKISGEIISGDSMQIYKGMDIGTAKVTKEEMQGIPHHLIDIKEPTDSFSVAEFQELVKPLITSINHKGKIPIIVGGTGLYISSILYDYQFSAVTADLEYRESLEQFVRKYGVEALHEKLKNIDPVSYEALHPNNYRRVIRALEVYHLTKKTIHEQELRSTVSPYNIAVIGLTMERAQLYTRINQRVDQMVFEGLLEEVQSIYDRGIRNCQSVQAIGYKEMIEYIEGYVTKEEAIERLKRNSRRYAKRQLTWFRNKMELAWFDMTNANVLEKEKEIQIFLEESLT